MIIPHIGITALSTFTACLALICAAPVRQSGGYALQNVYQFGNFSWIENMAIRANGHIIATNLDQGLVYDLDPNSNPVVPTAVATFPQGSTPGGITEVEPDVFYVNNGLGDPSTITFTAGTSAIWRIDMNQYTKTGKAAVSKLIDIPPAQMLNGLVTVSPESGIILTSDSIGGTVYSVNVYGPSYQLALDHPLLKPNLADTPSFGVNGLRIKNSNLYFCNTNYGYLGYFPLSSSGTIIPSPTLIISSVLAADDFDFDSNVNTWLAENVQNTLVRVTPAGQVDVIAGVNSTTLLGPVSARFGKGEAQGTLYVSTDGLSFDANGNVLTTAGKIVKIDTGNGGWGTWGN